MSKKLLLIDVDCGVDDAQAIMVALAAPGVEVLGITCCHGNTKLENVCKNVLRVLKLCNRSEIPVYRGACVPILGESAHASMVHGHDGLGGVPDPEAPGLESLQKEHAGEAMIKIVNEHANLVTLVATGPLTNLALAVRMDPTLPQKLKNLYIMGGNMESRGNYTVCGEFNFIADPEAAYVVLTDYSCPTYIATWEFTCRNKLPWEFFDAWVSQEMDKAVFIKKICGHGMKYFQSEYGAAVLNGSGFLPCDSYAMAAAIDESFVTDYIECGVSVELNGKLTRGMMVLDPINFLQKKKVFVMDTCNVEKLKTLLMAALK
ncbi:pyrimidine-specific ribonucleoside hydrolase RihA [Latimeria chalumnae]|nr:PREDICTED: pyrimidine-specific ribonucleoside hydrolase RihA-like [Latimeria chalumnae]XP_014343821.1 PREDICTED: pyrimidine-specific ribonucleoside hydrolase RihA-like [Latimeria chalumnae]XP_014343822.1 PREDICTED: pyrimidine-specific ribonucleoside hydrolase RihA-like [Latimeria chalumnae]|eukprot:XP_005995903.1 PREDICTED: pyrimidine-specific ribonucleoside hydrolase RihA-like [Latimeria chalumnae]